ncbi:hypothetical protein F3Y22_tig00112254pilonHSYRG00076 [Hibiscus syriacus]|uniref:Uncharacterized protein n=1 Tax=Hibiscus syriacus TaxID=106335 RepID=A0A6A2X339_HIBSY|nr:hypothetical protein F3Y22_tig00112254pilonHSYRG00076 [Hibiscus syriacus]
MHKLMLGYLRQILLAIMIRWRTQKKWRSGIWRLWNESNQLAHGFSGGVWVLWDDTVELEIIDVANQFIHGRFRVFDCQEWIFFTTVYASPDKTIRKHLWSSILTLDPGDDKPWLLWGDFNSIINADERKGDRASFRTPTLGFPLRPRNRTTSRIGSGPRARGEFWSQKACLKWVLQGDRNTRYFHASVMARRRQNKIATLKNEYVKWCSDKEKLRAMAVRFYRGLFQSERRNEIDYPKGLFPRAPQIDNLIIPSTNDEIRSVFLEMDPLKSPGVDGIHASFYQKNWHIIGDTVCNFIRGIFENDQWHSDLNQTFLVLIPKGPKSGIHQPKNQMSFVPGHSLVDNILITQEAYDRLEWDFTEGTLSELGIPGKLIHIIMRYVTSVSTRILWNGEKSEQFNPSRGLRQGDPLSSYLFVLCMERLTQAIQIEVEAGRWQPFKTSKSASGISHLMFADDMVLFAEATNEQWEVTSSVLSKLCNVSDQKVSVPKTTMYFSKNVDSDQREEISSDLRYKVVSDLGRYLGVPLLHGRVTAASYQYLVQMVHDRLNGWKMRTVTFAGRVILAKAALAALPIYTMQSASLACIWTNMRKQVIWCIGNCREVDFWFDSWLNEFGPLINHVTAAGAIDMQLVTVADMIYEEGNWIWSKFEQYLPMNVKLRIATKKGPQPQFGPDMVGWNPREDRRFTVKSAYELREDQSDRNDNAVWNALANFRDSKCPLCTESVEDTNHLLRLCPSVFGVWSAVINQDRLQEFLHMEMKDWITMNLKNSREFTGQIQNWDILFGAIIWNIWLQRNAIAFDNPSEDKRPMLERSKLIEVRVAIVEFGINRNANFDYRNANLDYRNEFGINRNAIVEVRVAIVEFGINRNANFDYRNANFDYRIAIVQVRIAIYSKFVAIVKVRIAIVEVRVAIYSKFDYRNANFDYRVAIVQVCITIYSKFVAIVEVCVAIVQNRNDWWLGFPTSLLSDREQGELSRAAAAAVRLVSGRGRGHNQHFSRALSSGANRTILVKRTNTENNRWQPPPEGWLKLNSDGDRHKEYGRATCGGLVRNNKGGGRVIMETDSAEAIKSVQQAKPRTTRITILRNVDAILKRDWIVKFQHVARQGKAAADCMGKIADEGSFECAQFVEPPVNMEEKFSGMLEIIDDDGNSFIRRANMDLQSANRTIATMFPDQVPYSIHDEDDENGCPDSPRPDTPRPIKPGSKVPVLKINFRSHSMLLLRKGQLKKSISSAQAGLCPHSGLSKEEDEYDIGSTIDDNESRLLMANRVLKTCHESLVKLQQTHEQSTEEGRVEFKRIKKVNEKFEALRKKFNCLPTNQQELKRVSSTTDVNKIVYEFENTEKDSRYIESLQKEIEEKLESSSGSSLTMSQLTDKIDDLIQRVVNLEIAVFSENASVKRLKSDTDELQEHVKSLEEDEETLVGGSDSAEQRICALERELRSPKNLNLHAVKMDDKVNNMELSEEGKSKVGVEPDRKIRGHHIESVPGHSSALKDTEVEVKGKDEDDSAEGRNNVDYESSNKVDADSEKGTEQMDEYKTEKNSLSETTTSTIADSESDNKIVADSEKGTEQMDEYKTENSFSRTASSAITTIDTENPVSETDEEEELQKWRKLYNSGSDERAKILLEYSTVLRNYKNVRKKLKEVDQKHRDSFYELAYEIRELKNALATRDEEIKLLRRKLSLTESEASHTMTSPESTLSDFIQISPVATDKGKVESIEKEAKATRRKRSLSRSCSFLTSVGKIRADIDELLEDNIAFWMSNAVLKDEVQGRYSSLCNIKEVELRMSKSNDYKGELELDGYKAARFQGVLLNMKQENSKVSNELKGGFDRMQQLKEDIGDIMANLEKEI